MKTELWVLLLILGACTSSRQASLPPAGETGGQKVPAPPALVYKTRADYLKLVPVLLTEDKSSVVSYPDPRDLKADDGFLLPVRLKKGYLLDKKGIGMNVAFLNMTYEDYAKLDQAPSMAELDKLIIDRDPLLELCDCGNISRLKDPVKNLNRYIRHRTLRKNCKPIK